MEEVIIGKYKIEDRSAIGSIACDTAFMGKPSAIFFDGDDILADALTLYFTDYEPESCFVAEIHGEVIGYLIGAKNVVVLDRIFLNKILPRLLIKAMANGTLLKKKNITFFFHCLLSFLKGEFKQPNFSESYPATLHINLKEGFRGKGIGSKIITAYLDYLTEEGISGVHLATLSDKAAIFFEREGFKLLYKSKRSYFKNLLNRDIWCYIYGKRL